eukprot:7328579-Ditylum_brightwellii.AAC.1
MTWGALLSVAILPALQTPCIAGAISWFGGQDSGSSGQHWRSIAMVSVWLVLGGFGASVGCVSDWTWLTAGNEEEEEEEDNDAYGTKNGVNAPFHHQPPP